MKQNCILFIIITYIKVCTCQRRLTQSALTATDQRYMVYLVPSEKSEPRYDSWLCGGAIVSSRQVLTSAACLKSVSHIYVIAGYRKYVNWRALDFDECTRRMKQKVISYCVPHGYNISEHMANWMVLDVGVAVVEKEFDFTDRTWKKYCTWIPGSIKISFARKKLDSDVVALGWGGGLWRPPNDELDPNAEYLHEMYSMITNKTDCIRYNLTTEIHKWIYCVQGDGNLDMKGNWIYNGIKKTPIGMDPYRYYVNRKRNFPDDTVDDHLRNGNNTTASKENLSYELKNLLPLRRLNSDVLLQNPSMCVGDHGGPLVTWEGTELVLVGIAVSSMIDATTHRCKPPSIFISTHCAGLVIDCMLKMSPSTRRSCDDISNLDGTVIKETEVNWKLTEEEDLEELLE